MRRVSYIYNTRVVILLRVV